MEEELDLIAIEKEWRKDFLNENYWKLTQDKTDRMAELIGKLIQEVHQLRQQINQRQKEDHLFYDVDSIFIPPYPDEVE